MNVDSLTAPYQVSRDTTGGIVLALAGELTIEHVRELHELLCVGGSAPQHLEVRCAGLTRLDAAAVQLLFAAARSAQTARVVERSAAWERAFARYGLRDPFVASS